MTPDASVAVPASGRPPDPVIWIRGTRLRAIRASVGLRLVDAARGIMSAANLSRIERKEKYQLPLSAVMPLMRRLSGVTLEGVQPEAWAREISQKAVALLERWQFSEALRIFSVRDVVVVPLDRIIEIQAQILSHWAQNQCGERAHPNTMQALAIRAQDCGGLRQAVWARLIEGGMYDRAGARERAHRILARALEDATRVGEPIDIVGGSAALVRTLVRDGHIARGREVLDRARELLDSVPLYGRARFLHAQGLVWAAQGMLDQAERALRESVVAAMELQNHRMAGIAERALADVYERRGETERADAAMVRAASLYTQAGDSHDAAEAISSALRHHVQEISLGHFHLPGGRPAGER